jgi:penicillin-binding protein activator
MKNLQKWAPVLVMAVAIALAGCSEKRVSRVDTSQQIDLSGKWNDTDSQMVSSTMITDAMSFPWANQFHAKNGRNPVVVAFGVKNRTAELINTQTFMKDLERAFLRSGQVDVVADRDQRSELREERADQQTGFTANPAKIGQEVGADFVLSGTINSIQDQLDNNSVIFYQTNLELVSVATNQKVWIGENKIKKLIDRSKTKF